MSRTATMTFLFTDIVGSTALLERFGERDWDDVRRRHFSALREALAEHGGDEVKNTGDGIMAAFGSAVDAVNCAVAMRQPAMQVAVGGTVVGFRIGISTGEATHDHGDWFGTPVVEAARLSALAGVNESWASALVRALAGTHDGARFVSVGSHTLKGFEQPIEVFTVEPPASRGSMYAQIDRHDEVGGRLVMHLDYWDSIPALQKMRAEMVADLAPLPGDTICDIGCGSGSELIRLARIVGPTGRAIGVDPSPTMIEETRSRAKQEGVEVDLIARDGRDSGLPTDSCDALRIERVIQHVGGLTAFLAEAKRVTRPGGRIVIADTDWGSMMLYPGDRDLIRRLKTALETGPMAEAWAGRVLHEAMLDAGLVDVTSRMYAMNAGPGLTMVLTPIFDRFVEDRLVTRPEIETFSAGLERALERGAMVAAFTMFVASGRVPD